MRELNHELKNKKIINKKLLEYGFKEEKNSYIYKTNICDEQFEVVVEFKDNTLKSKLIDLASEEEYILVDIEESTRRICWKSQ